MTEDRPSWDTYFVKLARHVATRSKDPSTKIGAVIVDPNNGVISTGYNSLPRGIDDTKPERFERPEKYKWFEHAERNAIYHAALGGRATKGGRIFLSCWVPCTDCARGIINAGITEVILGREHEDPKRVKWIDEGLRSIAMFREACVGLRYYEEPFGFGLIPNGTDFVAVWPYDDCALFDVGNLVCYQNWGETYRFFNPKTRVWDESRRSTIKEDAQCLDL